MLLHYNRIFLLTLFLVIINRLVKSLVIVIVIAIAIAIISSADIIIAI